MKTNERIRRVLAIKQKRSKFFRNALYLKAAPRFFYKQGKSNLAIKLLKRTYLSFFWGLFKNQARGDRRLSLSYWWRLFHSRFQEAASLIRFVPHFVRKRTKRVPFGARRLLRRKQLFRSFASLVRRSHQNSFKSLIAELQLVFKRSVNSKLITFRDSQHRKAESSKPLIRRGRLPHIPNFFTRFYAEQPKTLTKRMRKDKLFKQKVRRFAGQQLKISRISALHLKKKSSFPARRIGVRLQRIRFNLFFSPKWRPRFKTIVSTLLLDET